MAAPKFTEAAATQALLAHCGNVEAAARALGVCHSALWGRLKRNPRLQAAKLEAEEITLDIAEGELLAAVRRGEAWAVCFLLKTKGKRRGYVERAEVANVPGNPFEVSIMAPVMGGGGAALSKPEPAETAEA